MSENVIVENPGRAILLGHPFKDKLPNVEELLLAKNEAGVINTINAFCSRAERLASKYALQLDPNHFKGDALELLVEYMIKAGSHDNRIGIYDYKTIDATEDYGVDGVGKGENQNPATVQVKFHADPEWILTPNSDRLSNFWVQSVGVHGVKLGDKKNMLLITTGKKVEERAMENMLLSMVRVINREALREMLELRAIVDHNIICADALDPNHKGWAEVGFYWDGPPKEQTFFDFSQCRRA